MDKKSILILGRQPKLGLAELESLYGADRVNSIRPNVAEVDLPLGKIDFLRLGGSTRLANPLMELPVSDWKLVEKFFIGAVLDRLHLYDEGKLKVGLSAYGFNITPARLNATALTLKKAIRDTSRSVRVVPNQALELNTAQVEHNGLARTAVELDENGNESLKKLGHEFLLINSDKGSTILAETVLTQNIELYTLRDRGRPKRDARVGMLPPKLAQIMVNLAGKHVVPPGATIDPEHPTNKNPRRARLLDPFCGTGVVLQEALLMGYSAYGTDVESRMIEHTKANLDWFATNYDRRATNFSLATGDATIFKWKRPIDLVASETYLGQPFNAVPSPEKLAQVRGTCNLIIEKFLTNIGRQIEPGARLCLAVPAWRTEQNGERRMNEDKFPASNSQIPYPSFVHLPLIDRLGDLGYNRVRFEHVRNEELLYYREDQIVARELLVLTRS